MRLGFIMETNELNDHFKSLENQRVSTFIKYKQ